MSVCSMLMYYFWMVGQAHRKMAKTLREQLKVVRFDNLVSHICSILCWLLLYAHFLYVKQLSLDVFLKNKLKQIVNTNLPTCNLWVVLLKRRHVTFVSIRVMVFYFPQEGHDKQFLVARVNEAYSVYDAQWNQSSDTLIVYITCVVVPVATAMQRTICIPQIANIQSLSIIYGADLL